MIQTLDSVELSLLAAAHIIKQSALFNLSVMRVRYGNRADIVWSVETKSARAVLARIPYTTLRGSKDNLLIPSLF